MKMDYKQFDAQSQSVWNANMYDDICKTALSRCSLLQQANLDFSRASILDIGCGPGGISQALLRRNKIREIALMDLRVEGLQIAADNLRKIDKDQKLFLIDGDVHHIPLTDNLFSLVISRGSQRFWIDQYRAFQEIHRVLEPDGIAYIGGGRGSSTFQKHRELNDPDWNPESFRRDRHFLKHLPSYLLPDEAYQALFQEWNVPWAIYSNEGDGHWFCWQKRVLEKIPIPG